MWADGFLDLKLFPSRVISSQKNLVEKFDLDFSINYI